MKSGGMFAHPSLDSYDPSLAVAAAARHVAGDLAAVPPVNARRRAHVVLQELCSSGLSRLCATSQCIGR